jgi:hypothetical protein
MRRAVRPLPGPIRAETPPGVVFATHEATRGLLDDQTPPQQRATLELGDSATLDVGTTAGTVAAGDDARFVTNGDGHDHSGGDGAQIAYASLSGLPTLGTAASKDVGTAAGTVAAGDDSRFPTSGTYTPTLTNATNLATSTAFLCHYLRVGDVVTVAGRVTVDPAAAGLCVLGMSLPVASNFGALTNCGGVAACADVAGFSAAVRASGPNDYVEIAWTAVDTASRDLFFTFTYRVI